MNIPSQYTIPTIYARPTKSNLFNMNTDRDAQAQKALLGDGVYMVDTNSPSSPLNTPSPTIDGLSPLSVASHLQDACDARDPINPFLDASWKTTTETEADHYCELSPDHTMSASVSLRTPDSSGPSHPDQPVRLVVSGSSSSSPKRKARSVSVPVTPEPSAATLLPTIQEAASSAPYHRPAPPLVPRRLKQSNTTMTTTYSLPRSALGITSSSAGSTSSTTQMRRRPSPFPLGPPPPPPPQRRARYEPRPHIVDLATEQFNLKPTTSNASTTTTTTTSALEQERARQWKLWDEERLRSLEMTREAAKNNRVQTSRAHPSSSNPTIISVAVQEKPSPSPKVPSPSKSSVKRRWWCFGNGATESDVEDSHHNEKPTHQTLSRSSSRVSTASSATEEDDEEEWDEARTAPGGLLGFGCARKQSRATATTGTGESRRRATLKKRAL